MIEDLGLDCEIEDIPQWVEVRLNVFFQVSGLLQVRKATYLQ